MRRSAAAGLLGAVLVASCTRSPAPVLPASAAPAAGVCRVGPDGGPPRDALADKGIGGTGGAMLADKGIGGTGGPNTGIVAVITGFASICLGGEEVALPAGTPVRLGDAPDTGTGDATALRAGHVAAVDAVPSAGGLAARRVVVRFEVVGPADAVGPDRLVVAGQTVVTTPATLGTRPQRGEPVAVSGLRRADGAIEATRLEPAPPGPVLVHGTLERDGGAFHIGALRIARRPGMDALLGQPVRAQGPLLLCELEPELVAPDVLAANPAQFFGPAVGVVLVEGYGEIRGGRLRLGDGLAAPVAGALSVQPGRALYRFERSGGALRAVSAGRDGGVAAPGGIGGFTTAPTPDRHFGGGPVRFGADRPGGPGGRGGDGRVGDMRGGDGRGGLDGRPGPGGGFGQGQGGQGPPGRGR